MQTALYTVARDSINVLAGASFDADLYPAMPSMAEATDFFALLQANLHAAAQHTAMGHEGLRFRECPRPACLGAAQLICPLEDVEPGATDAELSTMLDQVMAELAASLVEATVVQMRSGGTSYIAPM
ncbi:MAG TPA: hypothetical protein VNM67_05040 [Thermoanaerobaculia bacterium]|nr:hypothetical protein [Thermoanaerobaculia bacterium]